MKTRIREMRNADDIPQKVIAEYLEPVFNNGLSGFETAIFRHSRSGGEGVIHA